MFCSSVGSAISVTEPALLTPIPTFPSGGRSKTKWLNNEASQHKVALALAPQRGICSARSAIRLSWISLLPA